MTWQWIMGWWNLVFLIPFLLALMYLAVYTLTGVEFGEADADADVDHDIGVDHEIAAEHDLDAHIEPDAGVDQDVSVEHDVDADTDTDAGEVHHVGEGSDAHVSTHASGEANGKSSDFGQAILVLLGVGRAPVSLLLMVLCMSWGIIGFFTNQLLRDQFHNPGTLAAMSVPIAGIGALLITRLMATMLHRYLPMNETFAKRRHDLLGLRGEAMYNIDRRFGMASVKDVRGNLFQVGCRIEGPADTIPKGATVKFVAYNADENLFYVVADSGTG